MRVAKIYEHDSRTALVSKIFDELIISPSLHLPFESIELHIRDTDISLVDGNNGIVCLNYNNPLILDKDARGVRTLVMHELFRLMFKSDLPREIEDVIIGREMLKRGFGDELCYMYYVRVLRSSPESLRDYLRCSIPWIVFFKDDKYNSELFRKLVPNVCKKKFPESKRLIDLLADLSQKNLAEAADEYRTLLK